MAWRTSRRFAFWGWAWIALTGAFALHVADEAANDFLAVYNPAVLAIRDRLPLLPLPTFSFAAWLAGLVLAIALLLALTPLAFRGFGRLRLLAYPYAVIMFLNGLLHIIGSVYMGTLMPGVWSSPVLLITAAALFAATKRAFGDEHSR